MDQSTQTTTKSEKYSVPLSFRQQKVQETSLKVRKCKNPRCGMCPHIEETSQISLNNETEKFKIKEVMDCDSRNLIYCIVCSGCGEKYIGQTGDVIRKSSSPQTTDPT